MWLFIHLHMDWRRRRGGGGECVEMKKQKKKIQTNTVPLVAYVILVLCCES